MNKAFIESPQKFIAKHFGYIGLDKETKKRVRLYYDNTLYACKMCGRVESEGYYDKLNALIEQATNNIYSFKNITSPFICAYCYFNYKNCRKRHQKDTVGDIGDIIVHDSYYEAKNFKSSSTENDLFKIFFNPPLLPYVIMLKEIQGSSMVCMAHIVKPTIDNDLIVVNYGVKNYSCPRVKTISALSDALAIKKNFSSLKINISTEVLFNSSKSKNYDKYFSYTLRAHKEFFEEYKIFLNNYNEDIRFAAKIMFNTYIKHKEQ